MERLVKNGKIFLNGTLREYEKEALAFQKLEIIEDFEEELGIDLITLLKGTKQCFISNGKDLIFEGKITDIDFASKELSIWFNSLIENEKLSGTIRFSLEDGHCLNQVRDFEHPIRWALTKEELKMANNLAKIRGKHQLTQTQLAEALGVTKQGVCFNETGKLSIGLAQKAAEYLHEDIFELLGTDVFVVVPKTEAQKEYLINLIKSL